MLHWQSANLFYDNNETMTHEKVSNMSHTLLFYRHQNRSPRTWQFIIETLLTSFNK